MAENLSIVIVEDHPLFREGLKAIIANDKTLTLLGEAGTVHEGFQKVKEFRPDVAIVDLSLPDGSGIDLTRDIREKISGTRILVLTMHAKTSYIVKALEAGALGYISKESASETLVSGLRAVSRGEYFLDSNISHSVVERLIGDPAGAKRNKDKAYDALTRREQEVMVLISEGKTAGDIAKKLFISQKTVENHRSNIMSKLDVHTTLDLVRYAARLGLIDLDLWKG